MLNLIQNYNPAVVILLFFCFKLSLKFTFKESLKSRSTVKRLFIFNASSFNQCEQNGTNKATNGFHFVNGNHCEKLDKSSPCATASDPVVSIIEGANTGSSERLGTPILGGGGAGGGNWGWACKRDSHRIRFCQIFRRNSSKSTTFWPEHALTWHDMYKKKDMILDNCLPKSYGIIQICYEYCGQMTHSFAREIPKLNKCG